uniref:C1q domain-containing protein n=1 Tax=Biomphalaria glabrata TaxID=6526 RepID=A0A2C9KIM3_BIOGL
MIQDFSLRKATPDLKKDNSNGNHPQESTPKGNEKAQVNPKEANSSNNNAFSNTSSAAESPCVGPACDLMPVSAVSRSQAAVSAVLTSHFGPAKDIMIPFDLELLDLSDNYDNTTGMFICTVPGTYVISLYLMSHPGAKVNARIYVNNRPIAALWADDSKNAGFYPSSSTQTIAQLGFGDQVYVMLVDGGYGESWVHANYNVFTIFLLYEQVF